MAAGKRLFRRVALPACVAWALSATALADGLSGYLPLNLEPEMERQIERVLILADEPILKRPFPVALVRAALPQACKVDAPLCKQGGALPRTLLARYGLTHASATGSLTHGADVARRRTSTDSPMTAAGKLSAQGYVQPSDYLLVSAGARSRYEGRTVPTGSMLSLGSTGRSSTSASAITGCRR